MKRQQSVLIVDELEETREVLQTALSRRGISILTSSEAGQGLKLAQSHHPDLVVLDMEMESCQATEGGFATEMLGRKKSLVMLGTARKRVPTGGQFVSKPYHYGVLIRKIEELLESASESDG